MQNLLSIRDLTKKEFMDILVQAKEIKQNPQAYSKEAYEKTLLMIFQVPSLRTILSFEVAMTQMGGHAINYHTEKSPWGIGKESIEDVAMTISRYCNIAMARMHDHEELKKLAENASIPVINGLTSFAHPCQILGDFLTIWEKKKRLTNLKIAYFGDGNNNVTHDLIYASALLGVDITVACPKGSAYEPQAIVLKEATRLTKVSGASIEITQNAQNAAEDADVLYTDSWMSYRVPKSQQKTRIKVFKPYQVTEKIVSHAKKDVIFMHCLPALRGQEVTKDVIDSKQSVVFDQAENRMHIQKAIIIELLKARGEHHAYKANIASR